MHTSDGDSHSDGECDCGNLDLAVYAAHRFVPTLIAVTGRFGFFVGEMGRECFVEPEQLPTTTLVAIASAADLIDAHDIVVFGGDANGMNFDDARPSIITKLKAFARAQSIAPGLPMHELVSS